MKRTGITRGIDDLGRVVIPKELRRGLNVNPGDSFEIFLDDSGNVILTPVRSHCVFCGSNSDLKVKNEIPVCENCVGELKE